MKRPILPITLTGLLLTGYLLCQPAQAQPSVASVLLDDWQIQVSTPIVFTPTPSASLGLSAFKNFPIGQLLSSQPGDALSRLNLSFSLQGFSPLSFESLFLCAGLGLAHSTPVNADAYFSYGLRYAPLLEMGLTADNNAINGYQGALAHLGFNYRLGGRTWTSIGLQGGAYLPLSGAEPLWVLQPQAGLNVGF